MSCCYISHQFIKSILYKCRSLSKPSLNIIDVFTVLYAAGASIYTASSSIFRSDDFYLVNSWKHDVKLRNSNLWLIVTTIYGLIYYNSGIWQWNAPVHGGTLLLQPASTATGELCNKSSHADSGWALKPIDEIVDKIFNRVLLYADHILISG